jgi:hypothetical protein
LVGTCEDAENPGAIHQNRIARRRPPGKGRAAYIGEPVGLLPAAAAEEAKQQQHENDDQDDPEDRHEVVPLSSFHKNGKRSNLGTQKPKIGLTRA